MNLFERLVMSMYFGFKKWIDSFVKEKGFDREMMIYDGKGIDGYHYKIRFGELIDSMKRTNFKDKKKLKEIIIKIDSQKGDLISFFKFLSVSLTDNYEVA